MFEVLAVAVDDLEVPVSTAAVAELVVIRDRLDAKITATIGAVDAAGLHEPEGQLSMAAWLRANCDQPTTTALRLSGRARKLHKLPGLRAAWEAGRLSGGQIDAILANLGRHTDRFAAQETDLLDVLAPLSGEDTAKAMQAWRAQADALDDGPEPDGDGNLHLSDGLDGTGIVRGSLHRDVHQLLKTALRVADSGDRDHTIAQRRAEALGEVCRHFLDHQRTRRGGRHRPHLNITLRYEDLVKDLTGGRYVDGPPIEPASIAQLLCDCVIHRVIVDGQGAILDDGRATRTVPVDLYNALVVRDRGCRYPGCDRPPDWCDAHHLWPWEAGGPTSLDNLVLACRRHHHLLHRRGWHAKLLPDTTLEITRPDGTTDRSPPPSAVTPPLLV